jgi:hypothetical protein
MLPRSPACLTLSVGAPCVHPAGLKCPPHDVQPLVVSPVRRHWSVALRAPKLAGQRQRRTKLVDVEAVLALFQARNLALHARGAVCGAREGGVSAVSGRGLRRRATAPGTNPGARHDDDCEGAPARERTFRGRQHDQALHFFAEQNSDGFRHGMPRKGVGGWEAQRVQLCELVAFPELVPWTRRRRRSAPPGAPLDRGRAH